LRDRNSAMFSSRGAEDFAGLTGSGWANAFRRKSLLWALAHTVGANDVFVAFVLAATGARRLGLTDELSEWRSAAACERRRCEPDGYGVYRREGVSYGFLLEYHRGTEFGPQVRCQVPRLLPLSRQRAGCTGLRRPTNDPVRDDQRERGGSDRPAGLSRPSTEYPGVSR
jgi:hypothetical protein